VAQSEDTRKNAYQYHKASCPIKIIPLGIRRPVFKKASPEKFGLKEDQIIFSTIGRLVSRKNIVDSLQIMASLKEEIDFQFIIMGYGPMYESIQKKIHELELQHHVHLMGNVSDEVKFQILDLSDMYISTALHEGFGLVFLEAMACGLPIISYNRGGHTDFLRDQKTGFLIELGNKQEFTRKIMDLVQDKTMRKKISLYNNELVEKHFYIDICADNYIRLFQSTVNSNMNFRN
jgi:glycosyltransferase involved in cell wall biosynthesis